MHQVSSIVQAGLVGYAGALVPASVKAIADPQISIRHPTRSFSRLPSIRVCRKRLPLLPNRGKGRPEPAEADETAWPDSEAEASAAALAPDRQPVGFVYFDESSPSARFPARRGCAGRRVDRADVRRTDADGSFGRVGQSDRFRVRGQCGALLRRRSGGREALERMRARLPPTAARCWWICPPAEGEALFMVAEPQAEAFSYPMSRPAACPCTH